MTSAMLTDLLKSLALLGVFLVIGMFLRAKVGIFQKMFLPASVLGGFLLLALGPQGFGLLGKLGVPDEWFSYYNILPGVLIVPVVAAVPLGLRLGGGNKSADPGFMKNAIPLFAIGLGASMFQFAFGFLTNVVFKNSMQLYDAFGVELAVGYVGGHGTAGTLGNTLRDLGVAYADVSQGVGTTTATFGIVGGIIIGIVLINWAARAGQTALLKKPADIPMPIRVGFEKDPAKQGSSGRETTMSSSIDTYAFHAAVIFIACGAAYLIVKVVKANKVPFLSDFSVWAYGMIVMFIIWGIMCALKIDYLADGKVKGHITGPFTEFAVIGAIASLPLKAVAAYIVPIVVMCILGYIVTTLTLLILCKNFLKGCWFEQMIGTFGMATGVFITGVLLLRICDPDGETPALSTYSMSYTVMSCVYFVFLDRFIKMSASGGVVQAMIMAFVVGVICVIFTIVSSKICFGKIEQKQAA